MPPTDGPLAIIIEQSSVSQIPRSEAIRRVVEGLDFGGYDHLGRGDLDIQIRVQGEVRTVTVLRVAKPAAEPQDLQAWSIANWQRIPAADRKRCLDRLRAWLGVAGDGPVALARWRAQVGSSINGKPVAIGSDDIGFHFGAGMAIRNCLREVMIDALLPQVEQPNGEMGQNWDDFYLGAIHALVTEATP